jgi:hypothetical protein
LEIARKFDMWNENLDLSELNIAERALSYENKDIVFDELMDYMKSISKREVVREWDLFQIVNKYFKKEEFIKIMDLLVNSWIEFDKSKIILFKDIIEAKNKLNHLRKKIVNSRSLKEKVELQSELNELEYNIAYILSIIIYSGVFYSYDQNIELSIFSSSRTKNKINICFWQWWLVDNALRWIFWINTYAVWINKESYSHFITMLTWWSFRTDDISVFNLDKERKLKSDTEVWWENRKVWWDVESVHIAANYIILRQNYEIENNIELNLYNQLNKQIPWVTNTYLNIWERYFKLGDNYKSLSYYLRAESLISENLPNKEKVTIYTSLSTLYYNELMFFDSLKYSKKGVKLLKKIWNLLQI